jgi:hypothetical protein
MVSYEGSRKLTPDEFSYDAWPGPDKIKPYNRALMAFWQTDGAQAVSRGRLPPLGGKV